MNSEIKQFVTIKEAAALLRIRYWKLQRAVKSGEIPSYKFHNSRRLVVLKEIEGIIYASRVGGGG